LIHRLFVPEFSNEFLKPLHDGALLPLNGSRLAFTTDSYVVDPIFFPGGNVGELAVYGTVNDLAMCGAKPLFLSAAMIVEEGLSMDDLTRVVHSMKEAAARANILIVTGDTKVVDRGKGDKLFITTSGIGIVPEGVNIAPQNARPDDVIILSGSIADHGIAIMSVREGLEFEGDMRSDTAPLNGLVKSILDASTSVHVLRDPTRGGLATALVEIAGSCGWGVVIDENRITVREEVRGACEILGLDPLYVANEGKLLAIVDSRDAETVLTAMKAHPLGSDSTIIGSVVREHPGRVVMTTSIASSRVIDLLSGEQLPRIC
jgi:hydrogenase expression/formation protein HypE